MNRQKVQQLVHGIYRVYWKGGGESVASVGSCENGDRWIAPANWITPSSDRKSWRAVKSMFLIARS